MATLSRREGANIVHSFVNSTFSNLDPSGWGMIILDGDEAFKRTLEDANHYCQVPGQVLSRSSGIGRELVQALHRVAPELTETEPEPEPVPDYEKGFSGSLAASFRDIYQGRGADGLYEFIYEMDKRYRTSAVGTGQTSSGKYYAKFISVVQSSGVGKTRTIFELANKGVIVVYLNLRDSSDQVNYPPQTKPAYMCLNPRMPAKNAEAFYSDRCCFFFAHMFKELRRELERLKNASDNRTPQAVIKAWSDHMLTSIDADSNRTAFFNREEQNRMSTNATSTPSNDNVATKPFDGDKDTSPKEGVEGRLSRTKLLKAVDEFWLWFTKFFGKRENHPRVVIAFDEAHSLSQATSEDVSPAHILCRTISWFTAFEKGIWVLFASTNSQVTDFSAPAKSHRSDRISKHGDLLFPPYTLVGWDQFAPSYQYLIKNPGEISTTKCLLGFGRPLRAGRWHSVQDDDFMTLARYKLMNQGSGKTQGNSAAADLAIISQRFALDVCFGHPDAVGFMDEAIASHLRVCLGTTEDRTWRFTTYASEPLLSHVAAFALNESPSAFDVLRVKLSSGMIEKGRSGELACRLLLLVGKDVCLRSIRAEDSIPEKEELIYCWPVSLLTYLETLFGSKVFPTDPYAAKAVKDDFKNAKVNFSHWISMSDKIHDPKNMNWNCKDWLFRHYARTSAVQCCHGQDRIDQVIPLYFDEPDTIPKTLDRMSLIMVSDKAKNSKASSSDLTSITPRHETINCDTGNPSIAILLDVGVTGTSSVSSTYPTRGNDKCWRINVVGISPETLAFLKQMTPNESFSGVLKELADPTYIKPLDFKVARELYDEIWFGDTSGSNMIWHEYSRGS
ncbi:hypothetical protein EIP86_002524 [Pleurotus ostreatoroseus]|nr:hypothetical protein EIP86_002524 [Pleurotus ostreatoroseus]